MATQTEWTKESVMEMGAVGNVAQDIADAHNAALAAEREQGREIVDALKVLLDCVDYKAHNCSANQLVGAVLPVSVIDNAKDALAKVAK